MKKLHKRRATEVATFVPEHFTMTELEDRFSAMWQYVFECRVTQYGRHVEDYLQKMVDSLVFRTEIT